MPISPEHIKRAYSDGWIAVRDSAGALLGIIPGSLPTEDFIQTPLGQMEVWSALTVCVVPTKEQIASLKTWQGFLPATTTYQEDHAASLARQDGEDAGRDQSDIGEPV